MYSVLSPYLFKTMQKKCCPEETPVENYSTKVFQSGLAGVYNCVNRFYHSISTREAQSEVSVLVHTVLEVLQRLMWCDLRTQTGILFTSQHFV